MTINDFIGILGAFVGFGAFLVSVAVQRSSASRQEVLSLQATVITLTNTLETYRKENQVLREQLAAVKRDAECEAERKDSRIRQLEAELEQVRTQLAEIEKRRRQR